MPTGGTVLLDSTPQAVANIERMLKFIGNVEIRDSDIEGTPLFGQQRVFDSLKFQRSYFVYAKGRSVLSPIKVKFVYDMENMKAQIKTNDKDAGILNSMLLGKKEMVNDNTEPRTIKNNNSQAYQV